jgi:capsular polysaccharide biosynthesis protein
MKRALDALISLYPKAWRERYENEFRALLDEVPPTWRTLFDVFGGALKMQIKIWSPWKIVATFALAGLLAGGMSMMWIPRKYVSTSTINLSVGEDIVSSQIQLIESRGSLTPLIVKENLYAKERKTQPLEDLVEQMRQKDIMIRAVPTGNRASSVYEVSFMASDAATAQRITQKLAAELLAANAGTVLDPANLPTQAINPRPSRILILGLISGIVIGSLVALFSGLKVWKLATALGIAGAIVGAGIGYMIPDRFASMAVIRYKAADQAGADAYIRELTAQVTSEKALHEFVQTFNIYPGDPHPERTLHDHLHISQLANRPVLVITFDDRNRNTAQAVVSHVMGKLMEANIAPPWHDPPNPRMTMELLDPPTLPQTPVSPNRAMVAACGIVLGLAIATIAGIRGRRLGAAVRA